MLFSDLLEDLSEEGICYSDYEIVSDEFMGFELIELFIEYSKVRIVVSFKNYGEN